VSEAHPFRSGPVIRGVLIVGTFVFCAAIAAFPLRTWYAQRAELQDARTRHSELVAEIDASDVRIAAKVDANGIRRDAKCFNHFVEPGEELYTVPGVRGCVPEVAPG